MRNYDNPITVLLTGSGNSNEANTSVLFEDFIFGALENADARFVVTHTNKSSGIDTALKVLDNWGINEDSGDLSFVNTFQGALGGLKFAAEEGRDVYVVSLFDPESENDLAEITRAKKEGVPTLNLCASLVDHFEGYESEEDRVHREAVTEAFEEQQKAKEEAEAVAKPARKRAPAKKATAPRKKAAAKPLEEESKPLEDEPEKPAEAPQSGTDRLIAQAVAREAEKKAAREPVREEGDSWIEADADGTVTAYQMLNGEIQSSGPMGNVLSGTIVANKPELPKELVPAVPVSTDVWQDVAAAVPATDTITVRKDDVVALGDAMKEMASGFNKAIEVYQRMVTGE